MFFNQWVHDLLYVFLLKDQNLIHSMDSLCTHSWEHCPSCLNEACPTCIFSIRHIAAFLCSETLVALQRQAGAILHRESPTKPARCQTQDTK